MRPQSYGKELTANTKTTMFKVPRQNIGKWNLLYAHNASTSSKTFSAWWYDASTNTEIAIFLDAPLTAKSYIKMDGSYILLEENDEIRVKSETGSVCTCIVTVELEYTATKQH
jgi:hypothetical protein